MKSNITQWIFVHAFSLFTFMLNVPAVSAQTNPIQDSMYNPSHGLIGRFQGDSIELRWAPSTFSIWQHAAEYGWKLERLELSKSLYNLNDQTPLTGDDALSQIGGGLFFPYTEAQMKARVAKTDSNTAAALQLLNSDGDVPKGSDPLAVVAKMQEEQSRRHGFAMMAADFSKNTANALGLRFVDRNIKIGKAYLYRIYIPKLDPELQIDTIDIVVDTRAPWTPMTVQKVFAETGDMEISINWPSFNDANFTAYDIERSIDQKTWLKLNQKPYVVSKSFSTDAAGFFVDTTIESNYRNYFYRVKGYSPFGDMGLYSDVIKAAGKDLKPPAPVFGIKVLDLGLNRVKIKWDAFATEKDFKGFYVGKSQVAAGEFAKISSLLSPSIREFIDATVDPLENNYYVIFTIDTSGNQSQSYVAFADLQDTIAPAKPQGLVAEIDTFGNVFLDWKAGDEPDIIGYRVYWSNDKNAEFSQITGDLIPGLNYIDSIELNTLTPDVYYRIAAVDHRYNHSEMSDILPLKRPDKVVPVSPVINKYEVVSEGVLIQWIPSSSDDVVIQELWRKEGEKDWVLIQNYKNNLQATFTDNDIVSGLEYHYTLYALDAAGNRSEAAFPLTISGKINSEIKGIDDLKISFNATSGLCSLTWRLPDQKLSKVLLYRNTGEGLTYFRSLASNANAFTDKPGVDVLGYAIKLINSDGLESPLSTEITLKR